MTPEELWNLYNADPAGTHARLGAQLEAAGYIPPVAPDPRVEEMYRDYELQQYDAMMASIVAANPDVNPNRLHAFIAVADGDIDQALAMYRHDTTQTLLDYNAVPAASQEPAIQPFDYKSAGLTPTEALHRAVEQAAAMKRRR